MKKYIQKHNQFSNITFYFFVNIFFISFLFSSVTLHAQSWEELYNKCIEYYEQGNYQKAVEYGEKAFKQAEIEFGKEHENYASSLNILALFYSDMGDYSKAEPLYKEAMKIYKAVLGENHTKYANPLHNLALLYYYMGDYAKAEPLYLEALKIFKQVLGENHPDYATSLEGLAILYYNMGDYTKAEPLYLESLNIRKSVLGENHPDYAATLNNLAILYKDMGDYTKAEPLYKEALEIYKHVLGENHPYYAESLNNLALLYHDMNDYPKAEPLYKEALKIIKEVLGENHPEYAAFLNNLAFLYHDMGDYTKAHPLYKEALNIRKSVLGENHPDYATSLINLALLYQAIGDYTKAEPLFVEANKNLVNQLNTYFTILSESEKMKYLKKIEDNFDIFNSFALDYYLINNKISSEMLNLRINTKGIVLSSNTRIRNIINKSGSSELISLFDKLSVLKSQISEATSLSIDEQKERGINLSQLENEANDIEKEISRKSDDYKKILDEKNITLQDIQKELKPNDAVIEYIDFRYYDKKWTDTIYYCALIVKPEYIDPVLVKLCTLDELKEFFIFPSEDKESYVNNPQKNHSLYKLIFQPLEEYLAGADNIYISPTGILNKVSFSSLIDSELKSRNQLLLDRYNINYPGNIKDIVKKDDIQNKLSQKTAVVFGGIKYDLDSAALLTTSSKFRGEIDEKEFIPEGGIIIQDNISYGKFNYLPGSLEEANIITDILKKNNFTVTEYTGEEAVEEAFKTHNFDKAPQILHISTHGFFFPEPDKKYEKSGITESRQVFRLSDNPLFRSGLVFAGANRIFTGGSEIEGVENGILTAYEVSNMDLSNVELVVLSACETGLGDIKGGEGVFGLQRAFKTAGVKTIIMSKWKVPDEQTVELMQLFYSNWLDKQMDKYTAFREAQKQMSKKYEPYFWAAFIIQ